MKTNIRESIIKRLREIETEYNVEILWAVESGSRAWGIESSDSDYDVRFIYRHEHRWYLNILPKRDVIEFPESNLLDISGWDLKKTLFLLNKSNPTLFEWLNSPITYIKDEISYNILKEASKEYFSPISSVYHYLHMAKGNYRDYLQGETVRIKKYFYVLRPLLACMWIEKYSNTPLLNFQDLMEGLEISGKLHHSISMLLQKKKAGIELGMEPKIPEINDFIQDKIRHFTDRSQNFNPADKPPAEKLDLLFFTLLNPNSK